MADSQTPSTGDLVNLDEATQGSLDSGAGGSNDSILGAAEMFQQQLEQMTTWKTQLAQQMDLMRRDGVKLLERQKNLAVERKQIADERGQLTTERESIRKLQSEADAEGKRLAQRAGELEQLQQQLIGLQHQREQGERELLARQKGLTEQEARHLAEDVRLREGLTQLEEQRKQLAEAHRQTAQEHETLAARLKELDQRASGLDQQNQSLQGREQEVNRARQQLEQERAGLQQREQEIQRQQGELQGRLAEVQTNEQRLNEERQTVAKQRQELQRKLEAFEHEHAEQLDSLSKQTKRLSERRQEVELAETNVEKALADRITKATDVLKSELAKANESHGHEISQLESQLQQSAAAAANWQAREQQFQGDLSSARQQLDQLKDELRSVGASLESITGEKNVIAQQLYAQIEQSKQEAAKWQQALQDARSQSTGGSEALQGAQGELTAARGELDDLKNKFASLQAAKEELEFQLELRKEEQDKELEGIKTQLKQKAKAIISEKSKELEGQVKTLEAQRDELASQLFSAQDHLRQQQEESLLAKNALEAKIANLESAPPAPAGDGAAIGMGKEAADWHRHRLLRQAKALRAFRQQIKGTQDSLEKGRSEIAQQREQLRARKENLEQVKRLLEKQEMVMARKLADHNAIKTVAAVGIFVIMVLGSVFFGVYRFVKPVYRSEATVQLEPPPELSSGELTQWYGEQMEFLKSPEITAAAWKILRGDENYGMHDVREEWLASLPKHMQLEQNPSTKTIVVRYTGPSDEGVAQVCNAIAVAYSAPEQRESTGETLALGTKATVIRATKPTYPAEDNRMMICLSVVAITLFVSLILVMIFRHFIARQLKEIDKMADAQDLEDIRAEMPAEAKPAAE